MSDYLVIFVILLCYQIYTMKIKKQLLILLLAGIPAVGFSQDKIKTVHIKTRISCDHCRQCNSCSGRLEKALYNEKGIKRVDVDDKKMEIKVVYHTQKITADKIRETIAANGFDADDKKAPAEAVALLDDCCKGAE
jgi:copper chaperone CopZ